MSSKILQNIVKVYVIIIQILIVAYISIANNYIGSNVSVNEKPNQYIDKVIFNGNKVLDKKLLVKIFNIQHKQMFDPIVIEKGIYDILNEYKKRGYLFAKAECNYEGETRITINIKIDEGKRIGMGKIDLKGNLIFPKEQILNMFTVLKSDFFDEMLFENDIERLLKFYSDNGYPKAVISPTIFDIDNNRLNIAVQIDAGSMNKIGNIKINGLKKTKEKVVIREIPIRSGDVFSQSKIDDTEKLLNNIRYFQLSSPITFTTKDNDLDLNLSLVELPSGRFNGIIGYNPSGDETKKFIGTISAEELNLFGTGRQIAILGKFGITDAYEFSYEEPWIFEKPINIGLMLHSIDRPDSLTNQKFQERGIRLDIIGKITGFSKGAIGLAYKQIKSFPIDKESEKIFDIQNTKKDKYSVIFELQRDSRDNFVNATKGRFDKVGAEYSLGDLKTFKLWADFNQYFKIYRQQVFAIGIHAGKIWGNDIPITELFYLGGANTLRGYSEDLFRGEGRAYSNVEYRLLTSGNSHFFLFLDSGTVFSQLDQFNKLKVGYGLGMRIESMNGTISIDYGLAKGESMLKGKIHVSLGAVF